MAVMATTSTTTLVSGVAFGAAMVAAGFANPAVVASQMKFESWHMFQAFLAATASSALIYSVAEKLGYAKIQPRSAAPLGLFSRYDGNVLGGALLGAGMAISGSCPGTLYAQLATGVRTGFFALAGALAGGALWTGYLAPWVKRRREDTCIKPEAAVVSDSLGLSRGATLVLFEAACVAVVVATAGSAKSKALDGTSLIPAGAVGGLLIGLAQLVSLVTRRTMVGISGSFEDVGNYFWWIVRDGAAADKRPRTYQNIMFAAGAAAGAWAIAQALPDSVIFGAVAGPVLEVPPLRAVAGGVLMGVGSRLAGGCTSGHGISGMSLLSASSVVTIASTFGAGALVAPLIY
ncbi:YeeE/YedE family protein [Purpureocillium lavendulum]|uniref:YeeE/YedE family protein n=1 Tax=Purpureocillium lavendulum TaxID=1247861 RepID=A0AB34G7X5_9HYPO|nr:YeeE/YedE family protein [Purpureocillium lavendulum]